MKRSFKREFAKLAVPESVSNLIHEVRRIYAASQNKSSSSINLFVHFLTAAADQPTYFSTLAQHVACSAQTTLLSMLLAAVLLASLGASMLPAETVQICCCGAAVLLADLDAPVIAAESIISSLLLAPRLTAYGYPPMFAAETLSLCYRGASLHLALLTASVGDAESTFSSVLGTTFLKTGVGPSMLSAQAPSMCWRGAAPPVAYRLLVFLRLPSVRSHHHQAGVLL